jgi:eukaryotic-like serine/threonine-protein kinase
MNAEVSHAKQIFLEAIEIRNMDQRAEFLDRACSGNTELRRRVVALLQAFDEPGSFLAQPLMEAIDMPTLTPLTGGSDSANRGNSTAPGCAVFSPELSFLEPCNRPDRLGKLGEYEVLELIGCGGMGIVLRAYDTKLQRVVAIKVLAPHLSLHPTAARRFLREAQAAAAVSHERVVTIFAVEEVADPPYLVMEYVQGQSLQQKIDRCGALGAREILRIGMQIADGLAAAHQQGLVHRDIKPSNILLENGVERVKITDFGLARAVDDVGITQTGHITGTPQYMSPEQAAGDELDMRSDLFSLGSVLYTLCTGRPAFRAESAVAVLRRVCDDTPRPIREVNPAIPEFLIQVIDKLLAKRPEDRFQSAAEVADTLSRYLAWMQQCSQARSARPLPSLSPEDSSKPAPARRRDLDLALAALCLVVAVSFLPAVRAWLTLPTRVVWNWIGPGSSTSTLPSASRESMPIPPPPWDTIPEGLQSRLDQEAQALHGPSPIRMPCSPQEIRDRQEQWAQYLELPVEFTDDLGMTFRLIPPGRFEMGYADFELNARLQELEQMGAHDFAQFTLRSSGPRHRVELTRPFYLSQFEVTLGQFRQFVEATGYQSTLESSEPASYSWRDWDSDEASPHHPVCGISWEDARAYCQWRSQVTKRLHGLPTEAQWEYACRAGGSGLWTFGSDASQLVHYASFGDPQRSGPYAVGSREPNAFGLFDMHGNVEEWCLDWHSRDYYIRSPTADPACLEAMLDTGSGRVVRGGSFNRSSFWTDSASRSYDFPERPVSPKGFRVAIVDVPTRRPDSSSSLQSPP